VISGNSFEYIRECIPYPDAISNTDVVEGREKSFENVGKRFKVIRSVRPVLLELSVSERLRTSKEVRTRLDSSGQELELRGTEVQLLISSLAKLGVLSIEQVVQ